MVCIRENVRTKLLGMAQIGSPETVKNGLKQLLKNIR
jgi:hypothetical protein